MDRPKNSRKIQKADPSAYRNLVYNKGCISDHWREEGFLSSTGVSG